MFQLNTERSLIFAKGRERLNY